jgi:hypothetical protein
MFDFKIRIKLYESTKNISKKTEIICYFSKIESKISLKPL